MDNACQKTNALGLKIPPGGLLHWMMTSREEAAGIGLTVAATGTGGMVTTIADGVIRIVIGFEF